MSETGYRIDVWLWRARFTKTRSLAAAMVERGAVRLTHNGVQTRLDKPSRTVHIGDTKNGSTRCDNSHYTKVLNWFNSFDTGLIYTPGDNEWTDCHRPSAGGFDPLERLATLRKRFFVAGRSLGARPN